MRFGELEFGFGGTILQEFLQFFIGFFFDDGEITAGFGGQLKRKLSGNLVVVIFGGGAGGDLILVNEALIEARSLTLAENARGEIEQSFIGRAVLGNVPDAISAGLRDIVLDNAAMRAGALRDPNFLASDGRNGGNGAVIFFYFLARDFGSDVAGEDEGDVVGAVITFEPFLDIGEGGGVEIFHGADDGPGIGMTFGIGVFSDEFFTDGVRLIFVLAFFVLVDAALEIEFFLVEDWEEMAHAIAFGEEDVVKHGGGNIFKEIGAVVIGGAVEVSGADAFHGIDVGEIEILAAAEHKVLEEMSETGAAGFFVFGADVIPGVDGDDWGFVVFVDEDGETVGENKFGVRDVWDVYGVGFGGRFCGRGFRLDGGSVVGGLGYGGNGGDEGGCGEDGGADRRRIVDHVCSLKCGEARIGDGRECVSRRRVFYLWSVGRCKRKDGRGWDFWC